MSDPRVVHIALEGSASLGVRIRAWKLGHRGKSVDSLGVILDPPRLLSAEDVDALMSSLRSLPEPPILVTIDPLAQALVGGDENLAKDLGIVVAAVNRLRAEFGCAVLLVHHTGKDKKTERGSSALRAAADVMIKAEHIKDSKTKFKITSDKMKDGPEFEPIEVELALAGGEDGWTSCYLVPAVKAQKPVGPYPSKPARKILEILRERTKGSQDRAMTSRELREASGLKKATYQRALNRLKKGDLVRFEKDSRYVKYWSLERNKDRGPNEDQGNGPPRGE